MSGVLAHIPAAAWRTLNICDLSAHETAMRLAALCRPSCSPASSRPVPTRSPRRNGREAEPRTPPDEAAVDQLLKNPDAYGGAVVIVRDGRFVPIEQSARSSSGEEGRISSAPPVASRRSRRARRSGSVEGWSASPSRRGRRPRRRRPARRGDVSARATIERIPAGDDAALVGESDLFEDFQRRPTVAATEQEAGES